MDRGLRAGPLEAVRRPRRSRVALVLRWSCVLLVAAVCAAALVERAWVRAQADAAVVLTTTLRVPVLGWAARVVTAEPRVDDAAVLGGAPATIARPPGRGPWPAVVFVNGATARGRHHPDVQRLARAFARAGYVAYVPDLPGLPRGVISLRTLAAATAAVRAAAARRATRGGRVAIVGVSVGASLALLVAEDPALARRVTVAGGIAPYTDLVEVVRLATTGSYRADGRLVPYHTDVFVSLAVARSLVADLPPGRDRRRLLTRLLALPDEAQSSRAGLRRAFRVPRLGLQARAVVSLLANRDPRRFDPLYAGLPRSVRRAVSRLSPITRAGSLVAPVVIASAPHDKYFPPAESRALAKRTPRAQVTVTPALSHAIPRLSLRAIGADVRLNDFVVRALRDARRGCPCPPARR